MTTPTINILSITPVKTSDALHEDVFNAYEVVLSVSTDQGTEDVSSATIHTITFDPKQVFTHEVEEDECALGGSSLITTLVDRLRHLAGI